MAARCGCPVVVVVDWSWKKKTKTGQCSYPKYKDVGVPQSDERILRPKWNSTKCVPRLSSLSRSIQMVLLFLDLLLLLSRGVLLLLLLLVHGQFSRMSMMDPAVRVGVCPWSFWGGSSSCAILPGCGCCDLDRSSVVSCSYSCGWVTETKDPNGCCCSSWWFASCPEPIFFWSPRSIVLRFMGDLDTHPKPAIETRPSFYSRMSSTHTHVTDEVRR